MKNLKNKNIIITGAGSGIGRLMSLGFAEREANLALIDIDINSIKETQNLIKNYNIKTRLYECDISDRARVSEISKAIRKDFSRIDILVNNAGIVFGKPFLDLSLDEMEKTMNVNYWGHIYFTKEFLPEMVARDTGNIVNIASSGGLLGMPKLTDYCASKFAEVGFTESLKRELIIAGTKGVKLTCVCPYIIETGMFKGFRPFLFNPFLKPERAAEKIIKAVQKDKELLIMPYPGMKSLLILKLLPHSIMDRILNIFGANHAMDNFTGRS